MPSVAVEIQKQYVVGSQIGQDKGTQTKEWLRLRSLKKRFDKTTSASNKIIIQIEVPFSFNKKDLKMKHNDNDEMASKTKKAHRFTTLPRFVHWLLVIFLDEEASMICLSAPIQIRGLKFDTKLIRISSMIFVSLVVKSNVEWDAKPLRS